MKTKMFPCAACGEAIAANQSYEFEDRKLCQRCYREMVRKEIGDVCTKKTADNT